MLSIMNTRKRSSYIIGIDEVGRGPLAGPVVVCAVAIPRALRMISVERTIPLRDSKKLSARQRKTWAAAITTNPHIRHAVATASPTVIDRINVTQAANRSATRALKKLLAILPAPGRVDVFLDGGLYLKNFQFSLSHFPHATLRAKTVIKGDETIPAISLASILAKEHRDALMRRAHKKFPLYGFDRHVGYGTKIHIAAIKQNGRTPLHRNSFLKKIA